MLEVKSEERQEQESGKVIVSIKDFTLTFKTFDGTLKALEHVNLEISEGDTVGIIGESGSGKTTLATSIMGMVADNAEVEGYVKVKGEIVASKEISGRNFRNLKRRQKKILYEKLINMRWKDVSMVFQGSMNAFNPAYTIEKQIGEVFKIHTKLTDEQIRKKSIEVIEAAGLNKSVLKSFPHELSGGMKQRAVIAMALSLSPSLIIADEPTTGLDVVIQAKIIEELKKIQRQQGKAMIIISHDIGVVSQLSKKVIVLYAGRIMESGPTWDVYQRPLNPYTLALMNSYPSLERAKRKMNGIPGETPDPYAERKGCLFAGRCSFADDKCFSETPELREIQKGRYSRCHYAEKLVGIQVNADFQQADQNIGGFSGNNETILKLENVKEYFTLRASAAGSLFSREEGSKYVRAVDDLSIEIQRGEIFGVIGESGSGKTTLARVIVKLLDATSGKILYFKSRKDSTDQSKEGDGIIDITAIKDRSREIKMLRKYSQLIFQDPYDSIDPTMSVYDVVDEPIIAHNITSDPIVARDMVGNALSTVNLRPPENYFERFSHELSGGERQRVAASRALVLKPEFIVMDEPISMLDVSLRAGFMNLILDMRKQFGITVLYITHDLASARYVCDRLLVLYLGVGMESGRSEDVIRTPLHPYTKALLKAVPVPSPDWDPQSVEIIGEIGNAVDVPKGCRFFKRCIYAQDICKDTPPPRREMGNDHWYLCHFSQEELAKIHEGLSRKN
ncbi:MAG: ABC transporter ATP-binding protein [Thermoplasmata archaeon]